MNCLHCSNWGCRRCKPPHEVAAAGGGDNGLTPAELELVALRNRVVALRAALEELQDVFCSGLTPSAAEHDALMARVNAALEVTP